MCPDYKELTHAAMQRETVEVTRVPMDQVVETSPGIRTEGQSEHLPMLGRKTLYNVPRV
jgi:hypothetical protein